MQADLPLLPKRKVDAHKGDFGRALLVGGSRGMTGAIALAGLAALKSGAGLVTLAVPDPCLETVAAFEPSYMTLPLPADALGRLSATAGDAILREAGTRTAVAFGPGLGESEDLRQLAARVYTSVSQPMVFDADGLNALASQDAMLGKAAGPRILTPHPGELARLAHVDSQDRQHQIEAAVRLAEQCRAVVVLKGHRTLITDGTDQFFNETGNPGMATGGTGDVLTGVITGLLCQGLSPLDAARLGTHLHGRAGDLAAEDLGEISMTAHDLIHFLPETFCELGNG
jgi:ADP-dependent NAD(P)H-hydrate dehydratase